MMSPPRCFDPLSLFKMAFIGSRRQVVVDLPMFCISVANILERLCDLKPDSLLPFVAVILESHSACASDNERVKLVQARINFIP